MPQRQMHREVFLAHNGPGPWPCFECGEDVFFETKFHVHHKDGDDQNNEATNLVPMHPGCHTLHHSRGRKPPPAGAKWIGKTKEQRREATRPWWEAAHERNRGQPLSEEHRTAIGEGQKTKIQARRLEMDQELEAHKNGTLPDRKCPKHGKTLRGYEWFDERYGRTYISWHCLECDKIAARVRRRIKADQLR